MKFAASLMIVCQIFGSTFADVYLHNPRGSNDRLNADNAQRKNANRLFDSQNNAKGGYNVGEATSQRAEVESDFYRMLYFQSGPDASEESYLPIEWTNQHGCASDELLCNFVVQALCQPDEVVTAPGWEIRDGQTENTAQFSKPTIVETEAQRSERRQRDLRNSTTEGVNEPWDWYNECYQRERNVNIFRAERRLSVVAIGGANYSSAIHTRQNNNGNRHGYECPEERDYYPYFGPSAWKDVAVLTDNAGSMCPYYKTNSFSGSNSRGICGASDGSKISAAFRYNNASSCQNANKAYAWFQVYNYLEKAPGLTSEDDCKRASKGKLIYFWAVPWDATNLLQKECLLQLAAPDCVESPWTRSNHNGNTKSGQPPRYSWTLPYFPSGKTQRCVLRVRYNITSRDFDSLKTDASFNQLSAQEILQNYMIAFEVKAAAIRANKSMTERQQNATIAEMRRALVAQAQEDAKKIVTPVTKNPKIVISPGFPDVQFATNPDQMGRVFQDRSFVFRLAPRPSAASGQKIYNLNVRGKRGNIVQVYPAVEYDFIPNDLTIATNNLVHIQWTGSNRVTGDGEGRQGTDRSNMVQVLNNGVNYPLMAPNSTLSMWSNAKVVWTPFDSPNVYKFPFLQPSVAPRLLAGEPPLSESSYLKLDSEADFFESNKMNAIDPTRITDFAMKRKRRDTVSSAGAASSEAQLFRQTIETVLDQAFAANVQPVATSVKHRVRANNGGTFGLTASLGGKVIGPGGLTDENLALAMLTSGYYWCLNGGNCPSYIPRSLVAPANITDDNLNPTLDQAFPSFPGVLMSLSRGTYFYVASRNNKFSNREERGRIVVN